MQAKQQAGLPEKPQAQANSRHSHLRDRNEQGDNQNIKHGCAAHFLVGGDPGKSAEVGTPCLREDPPQLTDGDGEDQGGLEMTAQKKKAGDGGGQAVEDAGDGLDRDQWFARQLSLVDRFFCRPLKDEGAPAKEALEKRRALLERFAVTAAEADAAQTPQTLAQDIGNGHGRKHRQHRQPAG